MPALPSDRGHKRSVPIERSPGSLHLDDKGSEGMTFAQNNSKCPGDHENACYTGLSRCNGKPSGMPSTSLRALFTLLPDHWRYVPHNGRR